MPLNEKEKDVPKKGQVYGCSKAQKTMSATRSNINRPRLWGQVLFREGDLRGNLQELQPDRSDRETRKHGDRTGSFGSKRHHGIGRISLSLSLSSEMLEWGDRDPQACGVY